LLTLVGYEKVSVMEEKEYQDLIRKLREQQNG